MKDRVIVVGAGPVGCIAALALSAQGIPVLQLEAHPEIPEDPRAATLHPPTLEMLDAWGITAEILRLGLKAPKFQHRERRSGELVAEFDLALLADEVAHPYCLQCEQHKLVGTILPRLAAAGVEQRLSTRVTGLEQTEDGVIVEIEGPDGPERLEAAYVIGCDGGRSTVRKALAIAFDGFTYPERFLVLSTDHDFTRDAGYAYRNYFSDPEEWCALFKVAGKGPPGIWRMVFPTRPEEPDEEAASPTRAQRRMQEAFPKPGDYSLLYLNLYKVNQRVAASFGRGRAFLAGDAAHVNNPLGGMGMNSGIHDALNLVEKLGQVWRGEAVPALLERYDRQRRPVAIEVVQAQTIRNKKTLEERDPEVRRRALDDLKRTAGDPALARQFLLRSSLVDSLRRAAAVE